MGPLPEEINWKWHYLNSPFFFLVQPSERSHLILMSCHKSKQRGWVFSNFDTSEGGGGAPLSPQKKKGPHVLWYFNNSTTNFWMNCLRYCAKHRKHHVYSPLWHMQWCNYACNFPDVLSIQNLHTDADSDCIWLIIFNDSQNNIINTAKWIISMLTAR